MATTLYQEAVAEAKAVKETALLNAKASLEETLTPHIKAMLAAKLQEIDNNELAEADDETVDDLDKSKETDDDNQEDSQDLENTNDIDTADGIEDADETSEEDLDLSGMTMDDLRDVIKTIVAQETELSGEAGLEDLHTGSTELGDVTSHEMESEEGEDEEINLEALLEEVEALKATETTLEEEESSSKCKTCGKDLKSESGCNKHENVNELETQLAEANSTIKGLKSELSEINLLNAKLIYVSQVLQEYRELPKDQLINVLTAFDKAETVNEVKLINQVVAENLKEVKPNRRSVSETFLKNTSASRSVSAPKNIKKNISEAITTGDTENEINEAAKRRLQKLAGII